MKKQVLMMILAMGCALLAPTQKTQAQGFEAGVRDGVSLSWLVGIDETQPLAGFYAGIATNIFWNEHWGIGVDATLSEQGVRCKPTSEGLTMSYHYDYLNIPLVLHYQLPLGSKQSLRFSAGVQVGLFMRARYEYTAPSITGEGSVMGRDWMSSESFHPMDFGATVGAQWFVDKKTSIDVRYTLGITQTHNGIATTMSGYYHISVPDNRNSVLQIGTTFLF